ncbi:MAG: c-type cytochrome [Anaerolineae bacterium]
MEEETRRQGDKETRRQGDRETGGQSPPLPLSPSHCLPVSLSIASALLLLAVLVLGRLWGAPTTAQAAPAGDAEAGRQVYEERCAYCHGLEGDGAGAGAEVLHPRPRDFRRGLYKIRTTPSGAVPTDEDLLRVIRLGMHGTSMPGWDGVLTEEQQGDVVAYIKTFSRRFARGAPEPITFGDPIPSSPESIARGRELYFGPLECFKCHGQAGRGDGPSALELEDDFGFPIVPANLTRSWSFRGGDSPADIVRTFMTGMSGTPMPSYEGQMTEEDAWHLANFVRSLSPEEKPEVKAALVARRVEGPLPTTPDDPAWDQTEAFFYPLVGQIMQAPRWFIPSIDAITVRAVYNDEELSLLLAWDDRSENRVPGGDTAVDSVAVQFPMVIPEGTERPYFLEGDPRHPVNIWHWQADGDGLEELSAGGLGTTEPQEAASQGLTGGSIYQDGQWQLVIKRALVSDDPRNDIQFESGRFIPIAFSAWDGQNGEEDAHRAVSTWYLLFLEPVTSRSRWLLVPVAMAFTGILEGLLVWWVRRGAAAES